MQQIKKGPFRLVIGTEQEFIPQNIDWEDGEVVLSGQVEDYRIMVVMKNKPVYFPGDPVSLLDDDPQFRIEGHVETLRYNIDGTHSYDFSTDEADHWYSEAKDRPAHYLVDEQGFIRCDGFYALPWVKVEDKNRSSVTAADMLIRLGFQHPGMMSFYKTLGGVELKVELPAIGTAILKRNDGLEDQIEKVEYESLEQLYNSLNRFHTNMTQMECSAFKDLF